MTTAGQETVGLNYSFRDLICNHPGFLGSWSPKAELSLVIVSVIIDKRTDTSPVMLNVTPGWRAHLREMLPSHSSQTDRDAGSDQKGLLGAVPSSES